MMRIAQHVTRRQYLVILLMLSWFGVLAAAPAAAGRFEALFSPKAELWPRWSQHDPSSTSTVSHATWEQWLQANVVTGSDGVARVAYGRVSAADRDVLANYISQLEATDVDRLNRNEQFAFWVNLYNAATVQVVLAHYPVASIRDIDISPGLFSDGPWGKPLVTVAGTELTLNDIEHRILRPIWQDPRVHYVVNCASIGCPNLPMAAIRATDLDQQLDQAARAYINHPRGARIKNGFLVTSSIYAWFQRDFGNSDAAVIQHLAQFAEPELKAELEKATEIFDFEYDWSLNDDR